ncbi:MAG TPA: GNAT family protein [Candidatus Sulfotelmatobacter sp.]|nr:GNAT family protein [Candidatus Sulfotelmatobacter sp.]
MPFTDRPRTAADAAFVVALHGLAHARGYVVAYALQRMIARAFDEHGAHKLYAEVVAHNAASRQLCEKAGFVLEGVWRDGFRDDDGRYHDLCAYGLLAADRSRATR